MDNEFVQLDLGYELPSLIPTGKPVGLHGNPE